MIQILALVPFALTPLPADSCSASAARAAAHQAGEKSIVATAVAAGSFDTLATALKAAGLVDALEGPGPFTVFAPTDAAFAELGTHALNDLLKPENRARLSAILTYHVVPGRVAAKDVVELDFATTLNGQRIDVEVREGQVLVDGAVVTATDIACTNGIIHVIDRVIVPSSKTVVQTAVDAGHFSTLAAALTAGGLVEALSGEGPFTVFAPTDAAFAKLPEGTLEHLLKPENEHELVAILKQHVVRGRVYADAAVQAGSAATLGGGTVRARIVDGRLTIGGAIATATDVEAANGVVHVIDRVLLP